MRCRAVAHLRAVGCRALAVVAALFTVMAVMFAPQAMAADGSADHDTWADVAAAMDKQLQQGQKEYTSWPHTTRSMWRPTSPRS